MGIRKPVIKAGKQGFVYGLGNILNKLYGVYESVDQIPFKNLPDKCVIKTTHASETNLFYTIEQNFNINDAKTKLNHWMNQKLHIYGREWAYKDIKPKIIIEIGKTPENRIIAKNIIRKNRKIERKRKNRKKYAHTQVNYY